MKTGTIGIISKQFFENCEKENKYVYLTTVVDVTAYWQKMNPRRALTRSYYETRYRLLEPSEPIVCTVVYLDEVIVPDELVSEGPDYKMNKINDGKWRFHKVLLTIDGKTEVQYLHERCMKYFTWHDKE